MYGRNVHKAVLKNKEKKSGITIHFVNENYDSGKIILQKSCVISNFETIESLEIKIRDQLGVEQQLVTPKEISDLEPNLKKFYHGGVFYPNARHTINPRKVLLKFFDLAQMNSSF